MPEIIQEILDYVILYIPVRDYLIVIGCTLCALIIDKIAQIIIRKVEKRRASNARKSAFVDALLGSMKGPLHVLGLTVCCCLGLAIIDTPPELEGVFDVIFKGMRIVTIVCVSWYIYSVAHRLTAHFVERAAQTEDKLDDMLVPLIFGVIKVTIVVVAVMLILENLGVEITAAMGSLGIGAAAIALASKDTLANLFGSVVVFFDKPFQIGDWIELNGIEGTVEEIRLRTTLIRTYDNSVVTMPNALLTNACVDNFARRSYRKFDANFGVLYSTTAEQIETIVAKIKEYFATHQDTYGPDYYVAFNGFGDSSLDIAVTAYTHNRGKVQHMDDKQTLMLQIMKIVEEAGTGFAFPTRTVEWAAGKTPAVPMHVTREMGGSE